MGTTPEQKSAFAQLQEQMPTDLVPGYTVQSTGEAEPDSAFLKGMERYSGELAKNAYAYYNFAARGKRLSSYRRTPNKVLSAEGFPPGVTVTTALPAPQAFYTPNKERTVRYFVFHSFGHAWHASYKDGKSIGWLNSMEDNRGVVPYQFNNQTVYVAKGSDPETLANFSRFASGIGAALAFNSGVAPNFFIDRAGNLIIIGDCNNIQFASQGMDPYSVSVMLEEAFYVLDKPQGKNKATWKSGGSPPGTAGNVKYFAYGPAQMLTLSILCRKIETAFPDIKQRNVIFSRGTATPESTPPGYLMHDFIAGSKHFDISPQFLTQDLWDTFFKMVDAQNHITPHNVFRPRQKYEDSGISQVVPPLSSTTTTATTAMLLQDAKDHGMSAMRIDKLVNQTKQTANSDAGSAAAKQSMKISQQVASTKQTTQQTQNPRKNYPASVQFVTKDGTQAGSNDMW